MAPVIALAARVGEMAGHCKSSRDGVRAIHDGILDYNGAL